MATGAVDRDEATAEFFEAAARGTFLLRRCQICATWCEPQVLTCHACGSTALGWCASSGTATLVSWTIVHGRAKAGDASAATVLVIGQFDEGPWWWAQLGGVDPASAAELVVGQRLRIGFEAHGDHETVPVFELA